MVTVEAARGGHSLFPLVTGEGPAGAAPGADAGARLCVLRTAPVMDRRAAPLKQLQLLTRLGLGTRLGDGRQRMAMISLRDWVGGVSHLVEHESASGPFNLCCPQTPTNAEFTQALARAVHRKAFLVAPRFAIQAGAGPLAPEALGSVNLRPAALEEAGYRFLDPTVDDVVRTGLA